MPLKTTVLDALQQYAIVGITTVSAMLSGMVFLEGRLVTKPVYEAHLVKSTETAKSLKETSSANKRAIQELHLRVVVSSLNEIKVKPVALREPWEQNNLLRLEAERDRIIRGLK